VERYVLARDVPADVAGTSNLSVALRWGTVSPREVLDAVGRTSDARRAFTRQLAWRDWFAHLVWHHPHMADTPLDARFERLSWRTTPDAMEDLAAWRTGRTGVPLVDAGMRQLASTGLMHNRVRLVCASYLTKHLLVDWRHGERWFRHLLLDGDVAQNVGNWQWSAGCGPDAAPWFRILNPYRQAQRFDPDAVYLRRWLPELSHLDARHLHAPHLAPAAALSTADVTLGDTYPHPLVDLAAARTRALDARAALTAPV